MGALLDRLEGYATGLIDRLATSPRAAMALLVLLIGFVVVPGITSLPITDRDEGRYVQASKQMMETGDYIDIRNQDRPRWKKPVGIYWAQVAAAKITGAGADAAAWAYRLPSLLGLIGAALLTGWAARPIAGPRGAVIAALAVGLGFIAVAEAHIAKTDAALLATVVAAQGALWRIWQEDRAAFDPLRWIFWGALAAGVLIKGPIILLAVGGTLAWLCLSERSLDPWRQTAPLKGLALFTLIAAPWFIAIGLQSDGAFFAASVGDDLLGKVGAASNAHWGPPGYYIGTLWLTFWPWAPLALLALPWLWHERRSDAVRFLAGWALPFWLAFAVTTTKLPHYMLPIFPALAIGLALWLTEARAPRALPWLRIVATALFVLPGLVVLGLPVLGPSLVAADPNPVALGLVGLGALAVALAAITLWSGRLLAFVGAATVCTALLYPALFAATLPSLTALFPAPTLAALHAAHDACAPQPLRSVGFHEPSLVFYAGTDTGLIGRETAVSLLREGAPGVRVFVDTIEHGPLDALAADVGAPLTSLARVEGLNYNSGDPLDIHLVARAQDGTYLTCPAD